MICGSTLAQRAAEPLQPVQALTETGFKEQERSKSQPQSDLLGRMQASLFWVFARVKAFIGGVKQGAPELPITDCKTWLVWFGQSWIFRVQFE